MERRVTIEEAEKYKEDYQMRVLHVNEIQGILSVKGRGMNGNSLYDYDVSGKISMKALFGRNKINSEDVKEFLTQLQTVIKNVEAHLLNKDCILLKPEYIFYDDGKYYFCYYPPSKEDIWKSFHVLTEYFVKQADYQDAECIRMVFILHKDTMEENYSLDHIIEECLMPVKKEQKYPEIEYDSAEHDWITKQDEGSFILKETENMWTPVKKFLTKHKKPKWGDWDGLYVDEEDF